MFFIKYNFDDNLLMRFCEKYTFVTIRVRDVNEGFLVVFCFFDTFKLTERENLKEKECGK